MLTPTVNYLQVVDYQHDVTNRNESCRKDNRNVKRKLMKANLYTNQLTKLPNMTNNTSTDAISKYTWSNRKVAKQQDCLSAAPVDK